MTIIRFLSVICRLPTSLAIRESLRNALHEASAGRILVIADVEYQPSTDPVVKYIEEMLQQDWEKLDTQNIKRTSSPSVVREVWPKKYRVYPLSSGTLTSKYLEENLSLTSSDCAVKPKAWGELTIWVYKRTELKRKLETGKYSTEEQTGGIYDFSQMKKHLYH